MLLPDGYIKRKTSTIPFGYEFDDLTGYLKPIQEQIMLQIGYMLKLEDILVM